MNQSSVVPLKMEASRCKINMLSFVRATEPRDPELDLFLPMKEQVILLKQNKLKATFLLQYDALLDQRYHDLFQDDPDNLFELGLWLEVVQPLTEAVNIPWTGRYSWDWHAHCGFLLGYETKQRERLIDEAFSKFKSIFGYYPSGVGCWMIDTYSLNYIYDKYHIKAACICREQWGMDGYTLWGGYFSQGYSPSRENMLCPAQTAERQLPVPVFRMSGSDPIYDYDIDLDYPDITKELTLPLISSEACCKDGGANPKWVDWIIGVHSEPSFPFGYIQFAQENSFGWPLAEDGIRLQISRCRQLIDKDEADVLTLTELGEWYASRFDTTPACALIADKDWREEGRESIWYQSSKYRINLFVENKKLWLRDMHLYQERYRDRYLETREDGNAFVYDNLPFTEGRLWSTKEKRAGLYLDGDADLTLLEKPIISRSAADQMEITARLASGTVKILMTPDRLKFCLPDGIRGLKNTWSEIQEEPLPFRKAEKKVIEASHNGFDYQIILEKGNAFLSADALSIAAENNEISFTF